MQSSKTPEEMEVEFGLQLRDRRGDFRRIQGR